MMLMRPFVRGLAVAGVTLSTLFVSQSGVVHAGLSLPYYNTAGDNSLMTIFQTNGTVAQVGIQLLGYPISVRGTVWVGDRDDNGAIEYTLAGVPTGNTSLGGGNFSQLLDGTTDGVTFNYGVECCGAVNSVTRANLDWSGQTVLFNLPSGINGVGIAYDTTDDTLWVSDFNSTVSHYSLAGALLGSFVSNVPLAGLAYEQPSDTLWGKQNSGSTLYQYSKAGVLLDSVAYVVNTGNDWGGEFAITGTPNAVPEPGSIVVFGLLAFMGFVCRRSRTTAV